MLPFFGGRFRQGGPSLATAVFDHVSWPAAGPAAPGPAPSRRRPPATESAACRGGFRQAGGRFTVTGSGDIAPAVPGDAGQAGAHATIEDHLLGTFAGLIVVVVIGAMFMTAEYRRGLIRTTLAASPRRGRVLAAKAVVIGLGQFAAGAGRRRPSRSRWGPASPAARAITCYR